MSTQQFHDYISAELKTEEELISNFNDLKSNFDDNQEQYEYYPMRNEINSLDSIDIQFLFSNSKYKN